MKQKLSLHLGWNSVSFVKLETHLKRKIKSSTNYILFELNIWNCSLQCSNDFLFLKIFLNFNYILWQLCCSYTSCYALRGISRLQVNVNKKKFRNFSYFFLKLWSLIPHHANALIGTLLSTFEKKEVDESFLKFIFHFQRRNTLYVL